MRTIAGISLALLITATTAACGDASKTKDAADTTPAVSTAPPSPSATPSTDDENKVVYHDALVGNDVTVKKFRIVIRQMPKSMTCKELLIGGKALGNTYPNGEDFYLRLCKKLPRKEN